MSFCTNNSHCCDKLNQCIGLKYKREVLIMEIIANYSISSGIIIGSILQDGSNPALFHLTLSNSLTNGQTYDLTTNQIEDLSGNISRTSTWRDCYNELLQSMLSHKSRCYVASSWRYRSNDYCGLILSLQCSFCSNRGFRYHTTSSAENSGPATKVVWNVFRSCKMDSNRLAAAGQVWWPNVCCQGGKTIGIYLAKEGAPWFLSFQTLSGVGCQATTTNCASICILRSIQGLYRMANRLEAGIALVDLAGKRRKVHALHCFRFVTDVQDFGPDYIR